MMMLLICEIICCRSLSNWHARSLNDHLVLSSLHHHGTEIIPGSIHQCHFLWYCKELCFISAILCNKWSNPLKAWYTWNSLAFHQAYRVFNWRPFISQCNLFTCKHIVPFHNAGISWVIRFINSTLCCGQNCISVAHLTHLHNPTDKWVSSHYLTHHKTSSITAKLLLYNSGHHSVVHHQKILFATISYFLWHKTVSCNSCETLSSNCCMFDKTWDCGASMAVYSYCVFICIFRYIRYNHWPFLLGNIMVVSVTVLSFFSNTCHVSNVFISYSVCYAVCKWLAFLQTFCLFSHYFSLHQSFHTLRSVLLTNVLLVVHTLTAMVEICIPFCTCV